MFLYNQANGFPHQIHNHAAIVKSSDWIVQPPLDTVKSRLASRREKNDSQTADVDN